MRRALREHVSAQRGQAVVDPAHLGWPLEESLGVAHDPATIEDHIAALSPGGRPARSPVRRAGRRARRPGARSRYSFAMPISDRLVSSRLVRKLATKYSDEWVFSPLLVKLSTKFVYPLATRLMGDDVVFMDWAYEEDPAMALPLAESDEPNRAHINLYHRTATQADLSGKRVLEISCGRGGGASYLVRTLHPASYTGLDLNPNGIAFCQKRHNHLPGLDFLQGNAEDLPFDDQSFDVVLNVEASHLYPRFPRFLTEVERVLRAGGDFLYTDVRPRAGFADWEAALAEAPMRMMSQRVINKEVMRGIEASGQEMLAILGPVTRRAPSFIDGLARRASDLRASTFYQALQSGETSYRIYSFKKD